MDKKERIEVISAITWLTIIGVIASIILNYTTDIFKDSNKIKQNTIQEAPSEYPDFEMYKTLRKQTLVNDRESYVTKNYKIIGEVSGNLLLRGKIARAYIFFEGTVDNNKPLSVYDSIYIQINNSGGHLRRDKSLKVPPAESTRILYDLREIPYIDNVPYSENTEFKTTNWLTSLNNNGGGNYKAFLSTWRPGGLIKDISIGYECEPEDNCEIILK